VGTHPAIGEGAGFVDNAREENKARAADEIELELVQSHMAQKPVLRGEVGCACVAREVSFERGGMGERMKFT